MRMDKPGTETGKKEGPTCSGRHSRAVTCNGFDMDRSQKAESESPGPGSAKKAAGDAAT